MTLRTQHDKPVYVRLRETIADAIMAGKYGDGDPLPSVRALAAEEQANPLTVAKAYQGFQDEGLIVVKRGVGMFVAPGARSRLSTSERSRFLKEEWPEIRARTSKRPCAAPGRGSELPHQADHDPLDPDILCQHHDGLHRRVRGLQPWPMASTNIGRLRCLIHRTALTDRVTDARPATIVDAGGDVLAIAAGGGSVLEIVSVQPEGRRAMSVREFLSGRTLRPGTSLGDR